ncbi:unnamed protein product, partial [Brassica rapa]
FPLSLSLASRHTNKAYSSGPVSCRYRRLCLLPFSSFFFCLSSHLFQVRLICPRFWFQRFVTQDSWWSKETRRWPWKRDETETRLVRVRSAFRTGVAAGSSFQSFRSVAWTP